MDLYYTSDMVLERVVVWLRRVLPTCSQFHFVDTSAGDGRFGRRVGFRSLVQYDINPTRIRNVEQKDWFSVRTIDTDPDHTIIGFNPPYGYRGSLAKRFIDHAASFRPRYMLRLLPVTFNRFPVHYGAIAALYLPEKDAFWDVVRQDSFTYPTRCVLLERDVADRVQEIAIQRSPLLPIHPFRVRVLGLRTNNTVLALRRAGAYANRQCYVFTSKGIIYLDRETERVVTQVKGSVFQSNSSSSRSSNPRKHNTTNTNTHTIHTSCSSLGYNWYKVDHLSDEHFSDTERLALVRYFLRHLDAVVAQRDMNVAVLSKSTPPSINLKYMHFVLSQFYKQTRNE